MPASLLAATTTLLRGERRREKTRFLDLVIIWADKGDSFEFKLSPSRLLAVLLPLFSLGLALTWTSSLYYDTCAVAGQYALAAGLTLLLSVLCTCTTWWRIRKRRLIAGREWSGSRRNIAATVTLLAAGTLLQWFGAALVVDCAGLLVLILNAAPTGGLEGCLPGNAMVLWLALPATVTLLAMISTAALFYMQIDTEFRVRGLKAYCGRGCCRPSFFPRNKFKPSDELRRGLYSLRRRTATAAVLGTLVGLLAAGLWFTAAAEAAARRRWSCPVAANAAAAARVCGPVDDRGSTKMGTDVAAAAAARSFKLMLWHEGYPIGSGGGDDVALFESYVGDMVSFAQQWNIARVCLQVYKPDSAYTPTYKAFEPASVARTFLDPVVKLGIEPCLTLYLNPKDTNFDRADPLSDAAAYIRAVEDASASQGVIVAVATDGEDLGALAEDIDTRLAALKAKGALRASLKFGMAKGASLLSAPGTMLPQVGDLYPELYWYGELAPGFQATGKYNCAVDCVDAMPCFSAPCVQTVYRQLRDQPSAMVAKVREGLEARGLLTGTERAGRTPTTSAGVSRETWALMSLEHLSGCCPERQYGPKDQCGTFDGFGVWSKDDFLDFLEQFAGSLGFDESAPMPIGLYEWQFVPPHWINPALKPKPAASTISLAESTAEPFQCYPKGTFAD